MHESGLRCYNPTDKAVVLINTVSENKQGFSKRQINDADQARTLYAKLGYPSVKYFRWIFQSQKIVYCPVTLQGNDIAHTIWGKYVADLKGNTTGKKPIHVEGDIVKIPRNLSSFIKRYLLHQTYSP